MANSGPAGREVWLDGLRGAAAAIVVWCHMTNGKLSTPYQSFWDSPAAENRHLYQLVPFRIIFSGHGMADTFFVVSGYSVSIGLINLRHEGPAAGFYQTLTSSVFRRISRLCFPVAMIMLASHVLFYIGLYTVTLPKGTGCPGAIPWGSPIAHIQCLTRSFVSIINLQDYQNFTLNDHFWTIPMEIRGSMKVYFTLFGLSNARKIVRMFIIGVLCVRSCWNGAPQYMAFFAGVLFAELSASALLEQHEVRAQLPASVCNRPNMSASGTRLDQLSTLSRYSVFVMGIYLLSLPHPTQPDATKDAYFPPDWFFLNPIPPLPWWSTEITMRTWQTFGAIMVIGRKVGNSTCRVDIDDTFDCRNTGRETAM
ncbi:hypothetical protein BKA63DRAFT_575369 [Paraphoma chrysanthemicola]|nr:hypothetical protein BKA63DRAFT_575369 [Paraphoma chrysanthemicola]